MNYNDGLQENYPAKEVIASCNVCSPSAQVHIITPNGPVCKRCQAFLRGLWIRRASELDRTIKSKFESGIAVIGNGLYARVKGDR